MRRSDILSAPSGNFLGMEFSASPYYVHLPKNEVFEFGMYLVQYHRNWLTILGKYVNRITKKRF